MKKILVPLDGSAIAEEIIIHVEMLARQSGAAVILMRVVPFLWPDDHVHVREMGDKMDKEASDYLFTIETHLVEKGIEASVLVHEGNVPEVICDTARESEVDLIAISTHGHGGLQRWALGSVTSKVIQASSVPLLVHRSTGEQVEEVHCKNVLIPIDGSQVTESIKHYYSTLESRFKEEKTINYEVVIRKGDPAEVICDFVDKNDIDLIAMLPHM